MNMNLITFLHVIIESGFALFCLLAILSIRLYDTEERRATKVLIASLLMNTVLNVADAFAYAYRGDTSATGYSMVRISNFTVFAGMFVLLAIGNKLLDTLLKERGAGEDKRLLKAVYIICGAGVALVIFNVFFSFLYSFDAQNYYHREALSPLITVVAAAVIVVLILRTFSERETLPEKEYRALMCIWVLPVLGMAAQTLYYGMSLGNICSSIAIMIMTLVFIRETIDELSVRKNFILNGESVERISDDLEGFLKGIGTDRQNRIRIRFTVEEALLSIWQRFGDYNMVKVAASVRFGKPSIRIEHEGEAFNPFSRTKSTVEEWSRGLLASAGISPTYSYSHGTNIMKIPMPEADAQFVTEGLLVPVYDLWNNILNSVSAPAMLIIVMSTILNTREVSEQGGSARAITGRYFGICLILGMITLVTAVLLSGNGFGYNGFTRENMSDIIRRLFNIVPENFIDPIIDFNSVQLILMGVMFAYATMAVGQEAGGIVSIIHQLDLISMQLAQWIANLMPVFTVFLTAQLMVSHNAQLLVPLFIVIPFAIIVSLIVLAVVLLFISARSGARPGVLLRKLWPSFAVTLRNGLDGDSYDLAEKCCIKTLGIQKIFTQRVLPLGLVLYMPASTIGTVSFVVYAAIRSGIEITPVWIVTAIALSMILLVAGPPIPGINLLSYVVIMDQLGIGKEYVIAAMIFDILFNAFASAVNQMMLQLDMILQAERMGLLNHAALARENPS